MLLCEFWLLIEGEAASFFALVVLVSDEYLVVRHDCARSREDRFLQMARQLPIELQMVLCNRLARVPRELIPLKYSESAFKDLMCSLKKK